MYELIAFNYNNITGNLFKSISILLSNTQLNGNRWSGKDYAHSEGSLTTIGLVLNKV